MSNSKKKYPLLTDQFILHLVPHPSKWTPELIKLHDLARTTAGHLCLVIPGFTHRWDEIRATMKREVSNGHEYISMIPVVIELSKKDGNGTFFNVILLTNKIRWYVLDYYLRTGKLYSTRRFLSLARRLIKKELASNQS